MIKLATWSLICVPRKTMSQPEVGTRCHGGFHRDA